MCRVTFYWATSLPLLLSSWPHTLCSPKLHLGGCSFIALQIFLLQGRPRGHDATVCMLWSLFFLRKQRALHCWRPAPSRRVTGLQSSASQQQHWVRWKTCLLKLGSRAVLVTPNTKDGLVLRPSHSCLWRLQWFPFSKGSVKAQMWLWEFL